MTVSVKRYVCLLRSRDQVALAIFMATMFVPAHGKSQSMDETEVRVERVNQMLSQARQIRAEGQRTYNDAEVRCKRDILSSEKCLEKANQARQAANQEAKRIEGEAESIENQAKAKTREIKENNQKERSKIPKPESTRKDLQNETNKQKAALRQKEMVPSNSASSAYPEIRLDLGAPANADDSNKVSDTPSIMDQSPADARWGLVGSDASSLLFADAETIRKDGKKVKMWSLIDYKLRQSEGDVYYQSEKTDVEYDCDANQFRNLISTVHPYRMGGGSALLSLASSVEWQPIPSGSGIQLLSNIACGKAMPTQGEKKKKK